MAKGFGFFVLQYLIKISRGRRSEIKELLQEYKTAALKRRKTSFRLENLGIPEEELLRQQELFAKARQQQQNWLNRNGFKCSKQLQQAQLSAAPASASNQARASQDDEEEDDI